MRVRLLLAALLAVAGPAAAHDFWLQPQSFALAGPGTVAAQILVGHGEFRQRSAISLDRVLLIRSRGPRGDIDQRAALRGDSLAAGAQLQLTTPGTHIVYMQTTPSRSDLPAIRFNAYLQAEGLTPAIQARAQARRTEAPGREIYSRRVKALIQVGPVAGPQPQVLQPIGLSLEIVPEVNPFTLRAGGRLPVRILYRGRPLTGALVKLNDLDADATPIESHLSDAAGRAAFTIPRQGSWQMNVIWTEPRANDPDADFETTFSSLTLGLSPSEPRR